MESREEERVFLMNLPLRVHQIIDLHEPLPGIITVRQIQVIERGVLFRLYFIVR